ncbi:MAG: flagellar biosynthetic protein FliR, partial [Vulcanimicrobiaceae bacterium]
FSAVPLGGALDEAVMRHIGAAYAPALLRLCLQLAAPAICVTLCVHIGLGVLVRTVPRFGHLSVAFPIAYLTAMLIAFMSLGAVRDLASAR